jgi:DtxR family Mn-dependent transcriptional regulator
MANGYHPPLEEYLETIYSLTEEGVPTIQARIAERLGHTPQTVSETVHKLINEGYLKIGPQKEIVLTDSGRNLSESIVRRHRLAERFIVDVLGLPWSQAHIEAGKWEHVISPEVENRFRELLDYPETCPHGNPIPGTNFDTKGQRALSCLDRNSYASVARITEQIEIDHDILAYLEQTGIMPGRRIQLIDKTKDGTLLIKLHGSDDKEAETVMLENNLAEQIFCYPEH